MNLADHTLKILEMAIQRCGSKTELAKLTGINLPNIGRWERGDRSPNIKEFSKIMDVAGVRLSLPDEQMVDYDLVPKVRAKAGAGSSLETDGDTVGLYAFRRDFLSFHRLNTGSIVLMDIVGDSMQPLLMPGDTVLVNKAEKEAVEGKVYVVTYGDELRVKRLFKSPSGVILRSDNKDYPDIHIDDFDQFVIHGRVRWAGRLL